MQTFPSSVASRKYFPIPGYWRKQLAHRLCLDKWTVYFSFSLSSAIRHAQSSLHSPFSNSCRGWEGKHLPLCAPYPGGMMDHIIICLRSCKTCNLLLTVPTTHSCDSKQIISMIQFPLSSLKCRQGFWPTSRVGRQGAICFQSASKGDAGVQSLVDLEVPVLNLQPRWRHQWQNQDSLYPEVFVEETQPAAEAEAERRAFLPSAEGSVVSWTNKNLNKFHKAFSL